MIHIGKNIVISILMILSFICCYFAISSRQNQGIPAIGQYIPVSIKSESMKGIFNQGDLILVKKYEPSCKLEIGDIITYYTIIKGRRVLNTHQIHSIDYDGDGRRVYKTKGVNNLAVDEMTVKESDVIGTYRMRIPLAGRFITFLQTRFGFFICILFPLGIAFLVQLLYTVIQYALLRKDESVQKMREQYKQEINDLRIQIDELKRDNNKDVN